MSRLNIEVNQKRGKVEAKVSSAQNSNGEEFRIRILLHSFVIYSSMSVCACGINVHRPQLLVKKIIPLISSS